VRQPNQAQAPVEGLHSSIAKSAGSEAAIPRMRNMEVLPNGGRIVVLSIPHVGVCEWRYSAFLALVDA
jgi:hypothetical protein